MRLSVFFLGGGGGVKQVEHEASPSKKNTVRVIHPQPFNTSLKTECVRRTLRTERPSQKQTKNKCQYGGKTLALTSVFFFLRNHLENPSNKDLQTIIADGSGWRENPEHPHTL